MIQLSLIMLNSFLLNIFVYAQNIPTQNQKTTNQIIISNEEMSNEQIKQLVMQQLQNTLKEQQSLERNKPKNTALQASNLKSNQPLNSIIKNESIELFKSGTEFMPKVLKLGKTRPANMPLENVNKVENQRTPASQSILITPKSIYKSADQSQSVKTVPVKIRP